MAGKLVSMGLWPKIPDDLHRNYFDMSFANQAEQLIRPSVNTQ